MERRLLFESPTQSGVMYCTEEIIIHCATELCEVGIGQKEAKSNSI